MKKKQKIKSTKPNKNSAPHIKHRLNPLVLGMMIADLDSELAQAVKEYLLTKDRSSKSK